MTTKIRLFILSSGLRLELSSRLSIRRAGLRGAFAYLKGSDAANFRVIRSISVAGDPTAQSIDEMLRRGMGELGLSMTSIAGYHFEVSLGANCSYTGIMSVNTAGATKLSSEAASLFANAWITQLWGIKSTDYIVRAIPIFSSSDSLISCIDLHMFNALRLFCESSGMRFTECLPALVDTVLAKYSEHDGTTSHDDHRGIRLEVLMEPEGLSGSDIVQFVLLKDACPITVFRFWRTAIGLQPLQAIARRIAAQHGATGEIEMEFVRWPQISEEGATA